jgi:hypothetical protein
VLPLCEQMMQIGIGFPELVALQNAILKKSDMDKLPAETAGYRVMKEIEDYNTLYDMKKQLYDLAMQILMMQQISAGQNKVMMTVLKLQCYYGLSEDQILRLPELLEIYHQKSGEDSYNSTMTRAGGGDNARSQIECIVYLFRLLFRSVGVNRISLCVSPTLDQNVTIQLHPRAITCCIPRLDQPGASDHA